LSSDCPIYHIFVSTATHGWMMVPLGTGRPRVSSAQGSRLLERVTHPTCGGAWPNVLSGASDTRRDFTDTAKASASERMRGHTRRGCSQRPQVRPSSGYGAAQAATRARQRRCAAARPPPHRQLGQEIPSRPNMSHQAPSNHRNRPSIRRSKRSIQPIGGMGYFPADMSLCDGLPQYFFLFCACQTTSARLDWLRMMRGQSSIAGRPIL